MVMPWRCSAENHVQNTLLETNPDAPFGILSLTLTTLCTWVCLLPPLEIRRTQDHSCPWNGTLASGDTPPDHDITWGGFRVKPIRGLSCLKISGEGLDSGTPEQCLKREPSPAGAHVCHGPVLRPCQAG